MYQILLRMPKQLLLQPFQINHCQKFSFNCNEAEVFIFLLSLNGLEVGIKYQLWRNSKQ